MCEFCEEKEIYDNGNAELILDEDNCIKIEIYGNCYSEKTYLQIDYCPMCGRKLDED